LTLEIFKINNPEFYSQKEHPQNYFDHLARNQILENLIIRGSSHKEFEVFTLYFASLLRMFEKLETLELRSIKFKDSKAFGEILESMGKRLREIKFSKMSLLEGD